ncbi:MAG: hypothetical protein DYG89_48920 [Caldilinea sp. CFX5]|nr:hypothetical protein [Caldilinea sp. CFX5]
MHVFDVNRGERLTPPEDWLQEAPTRVEALVEAENSAAKAQGRAEARLAEYAELLKKAGLL